MDWVPLVEMAHLVNSIRTRSALVSMMMVSSFTWQMVPTTPPMVVLRPDEQEIEDRDQDHERQKHAQ